MTEHPQQDWISQDVIDLYGLVRQVLFSVLAEAGAADAAKVDEVPPDAGAGSAYFIVTPSKAGACSFRAEVERPDELVLLLGSYETVVELWDSDRQGLLAEFRTWAEALVRGRYRERVASGGDSDFGRAVGELTTLDGQRHLVKNNVLIGFLARGPAWRSVTYRPYI